MKRVLLVNDTSPSAHYGCRGVIRHLHRCAAASGMTITDSLPVHGDWLGDETLPDRIQSVDLVMVNGEGTLHHDAPGARQIGGIATLSARLERPCVLLNSVYEGNSLELARDVANFKLRFVRESFSQGELGKVGLPARVAGDLLLTQQPIHSAIPTRRAGPVIFTDSVCTTSTARLLLAAINSHGQVMGIRSEESITGASGRGVRFRHCASGVFKCAVGLRRLGVPDAMYQRLAASRKLARHLFVAPTFEHVMRRIAAADLIVTGRFHVLILCLVQEVPFLAVSSNSHKIEGLLHDVGLSHRVVTDLEILSERKAKHYAFTADELRKIRAYREAQVTNVAEMFIRIGVLIDQ